MTARGLGPPLLVISDGATGLVSACELVLGDSLRQRCLIHRPRNLLAKVPKHAQGEVKAEYWPIFDDIDAAPGTAAVAEAERRANKFATKWRPPYPAAVECLENDFEHLVTYLGFPQEHWRRIRHSNFIERTFGETRRRVKVIGRLPGEQTCLSLVWAVLDRASKGWRGVEMTPAVVRRLQNLRHELIGPPDRQADEGAVAAIIELLAFGLSRSWPHGRVFAGPGRHRRLLVHRQHQSVLGRRQIQAAHVRSPLPELGIVGTGKPRPHPMRSDIQLRKDPPHLRFRDPNLVGQLGSQQPMRPMRLGLRPLRCGLGNDLDPIIVPIYPRSTRPGTVLQTLKTFQLEAATPHSHVVLVHPHHLADPPIRHPLGGQQHHLGPFHRPLRRRVRPHPPLHLSPFLVTDLQHRHAPHNRPPHLGEVASLNYTRVTYAGMH